MKVHPLLEQLLSKNYINKHLPKILIALEDVNEYQITKERFLHYWSEELNLTHRKQALCFFMDELIDLVNKTNNRLLYKDIFANLACGKKLEED